MNNFEKIKSMSVDELTKYFDDYMMFGCCPWDTWFDNNYCKKCESIIREGSEYAYCELCDNCKFFQDMKDVPDNKQIIKMWLENENDG